jgi:aryl-phospho-beta-D-glucosidase BglC (GH1 family)
MHFKTLAFLSCGALVSAWLPGEDKVITSKDNVDLFNRTVSAGGSSKRWLPASGKIRGVNMGSHFIVEPWLMSNSWASMGCGGDVKSEFDCVLKLGQDAANTAFQHHWDTWITQAELQDMRNSGLNTIRIPVGYWMKEDLVYADSEHFPQGALTYLTRLCGWASDLGFYIIMDLHGAPGAQQPENAFTGQVSRLYTRR